MSDNPERPDETTQPVEAAAPSEPAPSTEPTQAQPIDAAGAEAPPTAPPETETGAPIAAPPADAGSDGLPDESAALDASPFQPPEFSEPKPRSELASLQMLDDVELEVRIELGRAEMYIEDVLKLGVGSVVELDKLAGDPVDIFVNETLVARGEVLVLSDNFCVRINDIVSSIPELELST